MTACDSAPDGVHEDGLIDVQVYLNLQADSSESLSPQATRHRALSDGRDPTPYFPARGSLRLLKKPGTEV